jgi:hypothetical protein
MSALWSVLIIVVGGAGAIGLFLALNAHGATGPEMVRGAGHLVDDMRRDGSR